MFWPLRHVENIKIQGQEEQNVLPLHFRARSLLDSHIIIPASPD